jgi:hypothetical protein
MFSSVRLRLLAVLAVVVCAQIVFSQTDNGAIRGTVQDGTGSAVAGAVVTSTNVATGTTPNRVGGSREL